ncbi:MAG: efflux RND transporter permease subunit [Firmicutes bacterium]|nr:efflux RND transporter permease subunit [Bacillota bacterium]
MENKSFISAVLKRRTLILIMMALCFAVGLICYNIIPKQHFPKVVVPVGLITVVYPGATAEDIEQLAAPQVEHAVMEMDGYDTCETKIIDNGFAVTVVLKMDLSQKEVDDSFDDLRKRLQTVELPSGVTSVTVDDDIMDACEVVLALTGENISNDELSQRCDEIADDLREVDGVRKVSLFGDVKSQVKVTVDVDKLNDQPVSMAEIAAIIQNQNSAIPTGSIKMDGSDIDVTTSCRFSSLKDIENLVINISDDGVVTTLKDIADIRMEQPDDEKYFIYNNDRATIIAVYFEEGLNTVTVGKRVNKVIEKYNSTLPENISLNPIALQSEDVEKSVNDFVINLIESVVLVIIVIMIGMNFRNAFVVSFAIPLAIFINFIFMYIFKLDIQFVSLASLIVVLGMLVDNAIVVSDSIQKNLDAGMERREAVAKGTESVIVPVFVSMLTTIAGFSSLFTLPGAYHQLCFTFPSVIVISLIASFFVSIFVTPLMSLFFLRVTPDKNKKEPISVRIYNKVFRLAFKFKLLTIVICLVFAGICAFTLTLIDFQVKPKAFKDVVTIEVNSNIDDMDATRKMVDDIQKILDEQPEKQYYLSCIGGGLPRYDYAVLPKANADNVGDIYVKIDLKDSDRFKYTWQMVDFLQSELNKRVDGGMILVDEIDIFKLTTKPVEVNIKGENLEDLNEAEGIVNSLLSGMDGTKGIKNYGQLATYDYFVDVNDLKINTIGMFRAEAQNELSLALMGRTVSSFKNGKSEYPIVLDSNIDSETKLKEFKIKASTTKTKHALRQFADVSLKNQLSEITHIDGRRGRTVGCYNASSYSYFTMQNELEKEINKIDLPAGVTLEHTGARKDFMELAGDILRAAVVSLFLIFIILLIQFSSVRKVLLTWISIPFGALSGVAFLYITGQKLTFFALVGSISLLGCVLANAIVLVDYIDNEVASGVSVREACILAGGQRFRPILMSTMTTVLGLAPLALFGDALFVPMASLMIAGLATAMVINLVLVPMLYDTIYNRKKKSE